LLTERLQGFATRNMLRFYGRRVYDLECNWKVFVDNYLDGGYHVSTIHPSLAAELNTENYQVESYDRFSIQSCVSSDPNNRIGAEALYAFVYPNLMINRYGPVMDINIAVPIGKNRCRVFFDYFFEDHVSEQFIEKCLKDSDQVQQEDLAICASVQKGLRSIAYDQGRYAPNLEKSMHRFHCLLHEDYQSGKPSK
jgi:choline monooxygenase